MKYRVLGRTRVRVSPIGLGTVRRRSFKLERGLARLALNGLLTCFESKPSPTSAPANAMEAHCSGLRSPNIVGISSVTVG